MEITCGDFRWGGGRLIGMHCTYKDIISVENLCEAWKEFVCGKKTKDDVTEFSLNLSHNISKLHEELRNKTYQHGNYEAFSISDPKPRSIHKSAVRDRLLHHAIYRMLYPYFDRKFIYDSYSCRIRKGTHRANNRFNNFAQKVSRSNKRTCWVLKCDIRKFFASIDQDVLIGIVKKHIPDEDIVLLVSKIIRSFHTNHGKGLPLGNLTSQLLVNIYMNEFDQFMKHKLKAKYYIRYADDFIILSHKKALLQKILLEIKEFLWNRLRLELHPNKVSIQTIASGVDFLGWVHFPDHRVLRTVTKRRMFRNIREKNEKMETVQSYLGLLKHGNTKKLQREIEDNLVNQNNLHYFD